MCVGGILSIGKGFYPDVAIVGAEFLKSCKHSIQGIPHPLISSSWSQPGYSVYDYKGRVGFAPSINNPPADAPEQS